MSLFGFGPKKPESVSRENGKKKTLHEQLITCFLLKDTQKVTLNLVFPNINSILSWILLKSIHLKLLENKTFGGQKQLTNYSKISPLLVPDFSHV